MIRDRRLWWMGMIAALGSVMCGCASMAGNGAASADSRRAVAASDEVATAQPAEGSGPVVSETPTPDDQGVLMDMMVGQVNGEPIYASTVFNGIEETLSFMGRDLSRQRFRTDADRLIAVRIESIVYNRLVLGEAQRDLTAEQERYIRTNVLKDIRERIVREFGGGVAIIADQTLRQRHNSSLEEKVEEEQQLVLVRNHMFQKLAPKINVTRRDIKRYYLDNIDKYESPTSRVLRLIQAGSEKAADQVDRMLEMGDAFAEIASSKINRRSREAGLFRPTPTPGDAPFDPDQLNAALAQLGPGDNSDRIRVGNSFFWIFVESLTPGLSRSLRDAQLQIHKILETELLAELTQQYRDDLYADGSYDSPVMMTSKLVEIAMNRYAKPAI